MRIFRLPSGFSLIEVALALALCAFVLAVVVSLIPMALGSIRESREKAAAVQTLEHLARSLQKSRRASAVHIWASTYMSNTRWKVGDPVVSQTFQGISLGGDGSGADQRLVAHVEIHPPSSSTAAGRALLSVAWPSVAGWDPDLRSWTNAQGSLSTWTYFLPPL